jgi:hypothetical protein
MDLGSHLTELIPQMVQRWESLIRRAPWSALDPVERQDDLPGFLTELFAWTQCVAERDQPCSSAFLDRALAHGRQRRGLGLPYDQLMEELAMLRRAIFNVARLPTDRLHEMSRVDAALTVGLMASPTGYSHREIEAAGNWHAQRERLATEARLIGG